MAKLPLDVQTFIRISVVKIIHNIICIPLLFLLVITRTKAQDITINLSIRWENHIEANGETTKTPFLDITYINNSSNKKYYLLKQSRPEIIGNPLPEFYDDNFDLNIHRYRYFNNDKSDEPHLQKINRFHPTQHFFGKKYYITIDNEGLLFHTGWSAKTDTIMPEYYENIDSNDYFSILTGNTAAFGCYYDEIHYALVETYDSIFISNYGYNDSKRETFLRTEFTDSTISNSAIDNFVFLNPKEKHVTSYNLYGFKLVGGNFEFLIRKKYISDEVCNMRFWNGEHIQEVFIKLPPKVNGYQLYSGKFKTNHAFLEIKE